MSRSLIVNETAAGDLRSKGKTRTEVFAHSLQCDNAKERLDPFIRSFPSGQDPGAGHRPPGELHPTPLRVVAALCWTQQWWVLGMETAAKSLHRLSWCSRNICWGENTSGLRPTETQVSRTHVQVGTGYACVQVPCTQQMDICKNVTKKSRGLGLSKASAMCSKLHLESQIHNATRRLTSKNSSYDFSLACSEGFGGKVFLHCLLFHASELTSPCLHVPSWERSEHLSAVPVC